MIPLDETFDGTFPFAPHTFDGHGFVQHYVDEGPRDGQVVVCLHGEPTWGYLYRNIIPRLSDRYRVVVPDHMGFGKSETPQDREYTLQGHTENLAALVDHLDLHDITFFMQDWGGPIATAYTVRQPERVKRLFLANTLAGYGQTDDDVPAISSSPWFRWVDESLKTGRADAVLRNLGTTVLSVMKLLGLNNPEAMTDTWIRAYSSPFPTPESCLGGYEFPVDVHTGRIGPYFLEGVGGVPALRSKPAVLYEGMEDRAIPPATAIADFRALWPDAPVVQLPGVGHFCQEDAPDVLAAGIDHFIQANP
jgi:pimeloyl-ACP methyl ester carboxylesterase